MDNYKTRREQRECAVQLIYSSIFSPEAGADDLVEAFIETSGEQIGKFTAEIFRGVMEKRDELDAMISSSSANWSIDRISKISRSILRMCLYEIFYMPDIGREISINESLEIAKKYDDEKAAAFINGVTAGIINK